jgi:hypothetical protein
MSPKANHHHCLPSSQRVIGHLETYLLALQALDRPNVGVEPEREGEKGRAGTTWRIAEDLDGPQGHAAVTTPRTRAGGLEGDAGTVRY